MSDWVSGVMIQAIIGCLSIALILALYYIFSAPKRIAGRTGVFTIFFTGTGAGYIPKGDQGEFLIEFEETESFGDYLRIRVLSVSLIEGIAEPDLQDHVGKIYNGSLVPSNVVQWTNGESSNCVAEDGRANA